MSLVDHLIVLLVAVALPVNQYLGRDQFRQMLGFSTAERISLYRRMAVVQWIAVVALLVFWRARGRPLAQLGFVLDFGPRFWVALALAAGSAAGGWAYYRWKLRDPGRAERSRQLLDRMAPFLPRTRESMPSFDALAISAGICEEILYRGYFIWYASQLFGDDVLGLSAAVVATSAVFGFGHLYQGPRGIIMVFGIGLLHGALYVLAGSLWVAMMLHVVIDLVGGRASRRLHPEGEPIADPWGGRRTDVSGPVSGS